MTLSEYFTLDTDRARALPDTYNYGLVLLSYLVAVLGSYAFLKIATRLSELQPSRLRWSWLIAGAVAMGGGIWTMHIIGMLAHVLPVPVSYDPLITGLSMVPAVLAAGVALHVVARPTITTPRLLVGGVLMGLGIAAMHYTGMSAMQLNGVVRYDPVLFAASVVVALLLAILALQVRELVLRLRLMRFAALSEVAGALILGVAVSAMHYTAMASTYCFAASGPNLAVVDHSAFAAITAVITSLVMLLTIVAVVFDGRVSQEARRHRRTSEQLLQAQKMEAVGQLTGGVAHDFNNILTVVLANADAIVEDDDAPPHIAKRARRIVEAGQKAAELTRQLLAFSRKQMLKPEVSDLNLLMATTGQLLRRTLGEHIIVETIAAADLWPTSVDRQQVETSLINLCVNARDAMPKGGHLTIETRNVTLDRRRADQLQDDVAPGDYVMLSFTDTGAGMSAEVMKRAFEPFFTTKEIGKGTGLGLSMVYGFIRQSNGYVEMASEVGRGTAVQIYFPRSAPAAAAVPRRPALGSTGSERILVVEDEEAVRVIVGEQLTSLGYRATLARNAEDALEQLRDQPFDLVLTDVVMPGALNGKALADEVARRWPQTRVVFMSGYSENVLVRDGEPDSGVVLLAKPYLKADLAKIIGNALTGNGGNGLGPAFPGQA